MPHQTSPSQSPRPSIRGGSSIHSIGSSASQHHVALMSPSLPTALLLNCERGMSPKRQSSLRHSFASNSGVSYAQPNTPSNKPLDCVGSRSMSRTSSSLCPPSTLTDYTERSMSIKTMPSPTTSPRLGYLQPPVGGGLIHASRKTEVSSRWGGAGYIGISALRSS